MNYEIDLPCILCDKSSRSRIHEGCEARMRENLEALPGLYRALAGALQPGRRGDGGRPSTRTAPIPANETALDLRARGGIEGVVGGWARDLCERESWTIPAYQSIEAVIDWSCKILVTNLRVICDEHPAVREMADEIRQVTRQARALVTGERAPRRVSVQCSTPDCSGILRVTLDTAGERCQRCDTQYGHSEVLRLPLADRRAAA
ncbi:hypothetical protein [Streptomyces vietnamensis]|uniref:hypothetical protein n=1 Tax=Streptomyces vietnamensis TaxID=362257 RepID=UPI003440BE02